MQKVEGSSPFSRSSETPAAPGVFLCAAAVRRPERGSDKAPLRRRRRGTVDGVDAAKDIAEFLMSRRAKVTPEQVGLPAYGARRVKGLRREEVASLAGVSVEYYRRLERANVSGVSEGILQALPRAL